jgi:hypothetical protein
MSFVMASRHRPTVSTTSDEYGRERVAVLHQFHDVSPRCNLHRVFAVRCAMRAQVEVEQQRILHGVREARFPDAGLTEQHEYRVIDFDQVGRFDDLHGRSLPGSLRGRRFYVYVFGR